MNAAERMLTIINGAVNATLVRMAPELTFAVVFWKRGEPDTEAYFAVSTQEKISDGEMICALRRSADIIEARPNG